MSSKTAFQKYHLAANSASAVVICPNQCILHTVVINTKGPASEILTIYDGLTIAAGTVEAIIDTTQAVTTYRYDMTMNVGLTVVLNGGVSAADVTLSFG